MSININKYNNFAAYAADGVRPAGENCVSLVAGEVAYNGVNVMLDDTQINADSVCVVVMDNAENQLKFIPVETYQAAKLDTERFTVQTFFLFGMTNGKKLFMHKSYAADSMWAQFNRYKLECDTTAAGGFNWTVTINGTAKSGTVEWEQGATLDSIVAQMQAGAVATYLVFSHESGEDFIRVRKGGYSNSTFTLSNNTGATLTDLSLYTRIGGVQQAETHRDWQAQAVKTLFPDSPVLAANSAQYAKNGYNLSYICGGNLAKYKAYYRTNGSATWVAESAVGRMSKAAFNSCADGTIGGADGIALYNKYGGSWDAYMAAGMVKLDDTNVGGIEYQSYDNGVESSHFLASVTTMNFDGSYIPAYPAAFNAAGVTINGQQGCLPTEHELGLFMEDARLARINKVLSAIGGSTIAISAYIWSVAEYSGIYAWLYRGYNGALNYTGTLKSNALGVRPVLASA